MKILKIVKKLDGLYNSVIIFILFTSLYFIINISHILAGNVNQKIFYW